MTAAARAYAKALWESEEYTMRDIAAACGREMSVIRAWKREDQWRTDFEPVSYRDDLRAEAVRRVDAGECTAAIARELGVHRKTIQRWQRRRIASTWRCDCTPYGVRTARAVCPACGRASPLSGANAR